MPKKTLPVYVTFFGTCWKIRPSRYALLLRELAAGTDVNLKDFGTQVTDRLVNLTDLSPEEASDLLAEFRAAKRK